MKTIIPLCIVMFLFGCQSGPREAVNERERRFCSTRQSWGLKKETSNYWLPGLHNSPELQICLPQEFDIYPGAPIGDKYIFHVGRVVFWAPNNVDTSALDSRELDLEKVKFPVFVVRLTQMPDAQLFNPSGYSLLESSMKMAGAKNVRVNPGRWGETNYVEVSAERANNTISKSLYIDCIDTRAIFISYHFPSQGPTSQYLSIWQKFIKSTVPKKSSKSTFASVVKELDLVARTAKAKNKEISLSGKEWAKLAVGLNPSVTKMLSNKELVGSHYVKIEDRMMKIRKSHKDQEQQLIINIDPYGKMQGYEVTRKK